MPGRTRFGASPGLPPRSLLGHVPYVRGASATFLSVFEAFLERFLGLFHGARNLVPRFAGAVLQLLPGRVAGIVNVGQILPCGVAIFAECRDSRGDLLSALAYFFDHVRSAALVLAQRDQFMPLRVLEQAAERRVTMVLLAELRLLALDGFLEQ